jgi:hypothetical protein
MTLIDNDVDNFLKPVFSEQAEREFFVARCDENESARLALLNAAWYTAIADGQDQVRHSRPPLRIIFLMAVAEYVAKQRVGSDIGSFEAIKEFFTYISDEDKDLILRTMRRSIVSAPQDGLTLQLILEILYNVRNGAVHGEDFFSFALMDEEEKKKYGAESFAIITTGYTGRGAEKISVDLVTPIAQLYLLLQTYFSRKQG